MRALSPGAQGVVRDRTRFLKYQIIVTTAGGRRVQLQALENREFTQQLSVTENVDQPSMECTFEVQREWENVSLSPFQRGHPTNQNDPVLEIDNRAEVFVGIPGLSADDWLCIFRGRITLADPAGGTVKVTARDCVHDLTQAWIIPNTAPADTPSGTLPPEGSRERLGIIAPTPGTMNEVFAT